LVAVFTTTSADGTEVRAIDEGQDDRVLLLIGPGLDDGSQNRRLAKVLAKDFRVLRIIRRTYRVDLFTDPKMGLPRPTFAQEVQDIEAVAKALGKRVLIYGHSSGAVVALEALAAIPECLFGGVVFEPASVIDKNEPLAGRDGEVLTEARAFLTAGKPGKAIARFLAGPVRVKPGMAKVLGTVIAAVPSTRKLIPSQLNDCECIDELGVRLDTYATIQLPVVMLGGEINPERKTTANPNKNPAHIGERLNAVSKVLPHCEQVIMQGESHLAHRQAPKKVAAVITNLANKVMS
jgi:pimeloyl-ACP methyl ester carboxylesterase